MSTPSIWSSLEVYAWSVSSSYDNYLHFHKLSDVHSGPLSEKVWEIFCRAMNLQLELDFQAMSNDNPENYDVEAVDPFPSEHVNGN